MVSRTKKWIISLLWLIIFPAGLWFTYQIYPPAISGQEIDIFLFLLLAIFVASTPMVVNGNPIFLIQWISWAAFLIFGLFVELVMEQIALIVLFIRVKIPRSEDRKSVV